MRISSAVSMRVGAMAALFIIVTGTAAGQYFRGVNVSQAEWGDPLNETYGIGNYTYATAPTFNYFAARGLHRNGRIRQADHKKSEHLAHYDFRGAHGSGKQLLHGAHLPLAGYRERSQQRGNDHHHGGD